jgi:phosphoribosylaminoimidazole-succinocarboxamide synthase
MKPGDLLYEGKAKKIFAIPGRADAVFVEYKDSLTAFNAQKKGSFAGKGAVNRDITSLIYKYLGKNGVAHHIIEDVGDHSMVCEKLEIIPLEVVVRNRLAGSTAKKFNLEEGTPLSGPLIEFYYKDDALGDPFISDDQALMLKAAKDLNELGELRAIAAAVNKNLKVLFAEIGIELIDFKIEIGRDAKGGLKLADEITPDCCRLWDLKTGEKMDKDRFRRDLGKVEESYQEVWQRLKNRWEKSL